MTRLGSSPQGVEEEPDSSPGWLRSARTALYRVYDLCHPGLRAIGSNRQVIRSLFGVRIPRGLYVRFDPTTILLSRVLRDVAEEQDRSSLEVGIGQAALISLSLARRRSIHVVGIDCSQSRVAQSLQVARANGVDADFFVGDLLTAIHPSRRFDFIVFNPPYVPTDTGRRLRLTERLAVDGDQVWDGGADGTDVLDRFLHEAKTHLSDRGRIVFGVQPVFVPDALVVQTIERNGLRLQERRTQRFIPSVVYITRNPSNP